MTAGGDTIAAIATPPGFGGIGVVRISGPLARHIASELTGLTPRPRHAHLATFTDSRGETLDQGLLLFFPAKMWSSCRGMAGPWSCRCC